MKLLILQIFLVLYTVAYGFQVYNYITDCNNKNLVSLTENWTEEEKKSEESEPNKKVSEEAQDDYKQASQFSYELRNQHAINKLHQQYNIYFVSSYSSHFSEALFAPPDMA